MNKAITISLCMIVKDEEHTLSTCLESVQHLVDEIIIVDTGSTDNTKKIAEQFTKHVHDFEWIDDFSAARNASFHYATQDYILWLDADDIIKPNEAKKFHQFKQTVDTQIDAVSMKYHVAFDTQGHVTSSTRRLRLIKRNKPFTWQGLVHEDITCQEKYSYVTSDITIEHTKQTSKDFNRNLHIYEKAIQKKYKLSITDMFHYARELTVHKQYKKAIPLYKQCLHSDEVSLENKTFIYHQLATCYALTGDTKKEQELTLQSFTVDIPQPVFCCRMGESFLHQKQYEQAIFWYALAITIELPIRYEWTISQQIYQTWIPHKQLAFCYFHIGAYEKAYEHIQQVLVYQPNDTDAQQNRTIIKNLLQQHTL